MRTALARLPAADQEVLVLRHAEQLSTREAAAVLGVSETAVKSRHLRALERLRRALGSDPPGGAFMNNMSHSVAARSRRR